MIPGRTQWNYSNTMFIEDFESNANPKNLWGNGSDMQSVLLPGWVENLDVVDSNYIKTSSVSYPLSFMFNV